MTHKAIAIIPARGGSKRIPRKNLVDLGGLPLVAYSILSALKSKYLNGNVFVSTDDEEIAKTAEKFKAKVIHRPKSLATDKASTLSVLKHTVDVLEKKGIDFDTVVVLQPTCPFRETSTIDQGIEKLWRTWEELDAIFSVRPSKFPPNWLLRIKNERLEFVLPNDFSKIRFQDLEKTYEFDGVLFVLKKDLVKSSKFYPFSHGRTGYLVTGKIESIDIDDMEDLEIVRQLT